MESFTTLEQATETKHCVAEQIRSTSASSGRAILNGQNLCVALDLKGPALAAPNGPTGPPKESFYYGTAFGSMPISSGLAEALGYQANKGGTDSTIRIFMYEGRND